MSDNKTECFEEGYRATLYVLRNMIADVESNTEPDDQEPEVDRLLEDLQQNEANIIACWQRFYAAR
jgi:hypothetical protein